MNRQDKHLCLRCKTTALSELPSFSPDISFYKCPICQRQYSLRPGESLLYRWGHPISLVLYGTIFDSNPVERAEADAESFVAEYTADQLQILIDEIKSELRNPTQQVRDILGCRASEAQLREFLHLFANHVERLITTR